jgi:CDP-2,3-bis-(O-geranylgeranyl)-sn-glycerol synthase
MIHAVLLALWFLLPAACANVAPILAAAMPGLKHWNTPIDGGHRFRGKAIFGEHKTWRGILSGMIVATIVLWLEQLLVTHTAWAKTIAGDVPYAHLPTLVLGPLFGIGALGGDAIKSFFKRQFGKKPGDSWLPFDQLDYIIGSVLVSLPFVILSLKEYVWIFFIWFVVHLVASYTGWLLKLKERPI